jgi:hypothetical protein
MTASKFGRAEPFYFNKRNASNHFCMHSAVFAAKSLTRADFLALSYKQEGGIKDQLTRISS